MNHFNDKQIDQISGDDIHDLVVTAIPEDQWLDYRGTPWPRTPSGTFELLHDITSIADAEGGYLVVGRNCPPRTTCSTQKPFSHRSCHDHKTGQ